MTGLVQLQYKLGVYCICAQLGINLVFKPQVCGNHIPELRVLTLVKTLYAYYDET